MITQERSSGRRHGPAHRPSTQRAAQLTTIVLTAALALSACSTSSDPPATVGPSTTNSTVRPPTSEVPRTSSTTTSAPADLSTLPFSVELGDDGVTYDLDGSPPSGPSSFAVLDDGSVVIADTMAGERGEPRLLHYDRSGEPVAVIDLADEEVAAILDVVTDGTRLAILDVLVSINRYRVLTLTTDGEVEAVVDVPQGSWLEDGLTGLAWDDSGILLEFEFGTRYARLAGAGVIDSPVVPVFDGTSIELTPGRERTTKVKVGRASFSVERGTDLGGVSLVGIAPDGSIVFVVDEVNMTGPAIAVTRRVQRYSATGQLEAEYLIDAADQFLDIPRPFEVDATGRVLYLQARSNRVAIAVIEQ